MQNTLMEEKVIDLRARRSQYPIVLPQAQRAFSGIKLRRLCFIFEVFKPMIDIFIMKHFVTIVNPTKQHHPNQSQLSKIIYQKYSFFIKHGDGHSLIQISNKLNQRIQMIKSRIKRRKHEKRVHFYRIRILKICYISLLI